MAASESTIERFTEAMSGLEEAYRDGYNACLDTLPAALEVFWEESHR